MELANGCLEIFAALIILILYTGMHQRSTKSIFEKRLTFIIICHAFVLVLDSMRWLLFQYTNFPLLLIILSVTPTILSLIGNAVFGFFIYSILSQRGSIPRKCIYILHFLILLAIVVWTILICSNGVTSAINLQTSHESLDFNRAYWLGHLSWGSVCFFGMFVLLRCRKLLSISELWSLLSYCIFPLIALILRFFWDGPQIFLSLSLALIWIYVVMQRDQQERLEKQENQLIQSRVAILLSQIQPHFLFNALTTICGLCDENPKEAKKVTAEFADYLRHNLDSLTETNLIPFKDELQHIKLYLSIEKGRFEEKLRTVYDIQTEDFLIPSLTVQPVVENAVKHGILKKKNGGEITISTREKIDCFEIVISDDGVGFDTNSTQTDNKTHIGLKNVQERLFAMCKGTILVESTVHKGTIVTMRIPKEKSNNEYYCSR